MLMAAQDHVNTNMLFTAPNSAVFFSNVVIKPVSDTTASLHRGEIPDSSNIEAGGALHSDCEQPTTLISPPGIDNRRSITARRPRFQKSSLKFCSQRVTISG